MTKASRRPPSSQPDHRNGERALPGSLFRVRPLAAVALGGGVGGLARAAMSEAPAAWPWPTLLVNLGGAFALGIAVMYGRRHWRATTRAGVSVGLLGAFTTFSTLAAQVWELSDAGDWETVVSYLIASLLGGLALAVAGIRIGRSLR